MRRLRVFCLLSAVLGAVACGGSTTPSASTGLLSIWTNCEPCLPLVILVTPPNNGQPFGGSVTQAIPEDSLSNPPACGDSRMLTFTEPPGTYVVSASTLNADLTFKDQSVTVAASAEHCDIVGFLLSPGAAAGVPR